MKKDDVHVGWTYFAKVSDQITRVRIDGASRHGGWDATNLATKKKVRIKSAQRLRGAVDAAEDVAANAPDETPEAAVAVPPGDQPDVGGGDDVDEDRCSTPNCPERPSIGYVDNKAGRTLHFCQGCWENRCLEEDARKDAAAVPLADALATSEVATANEKSWEQVTPAHDANQSRDREGADPSASATKPKRLSALDAAAQVLKEASAPMNCTAMIEQMATRGLWSSPGGKTPAATLYSAILREIGTKGESSRFRKSDRGQFAFNTEGVR